MRPDVASAGHAKHFQYRPAVDGLRGVAVLAVLGFHAFPEQVSGGYVGVDVFFVVSGFLITGIIARQLTQGDFSFADFYWRRVRRLFPALVLVLATTLALGWLLLFPDEFKQLGNMRVPRRHSSQISRYGARAVISTPPRNSSRSFICGRWASKNSFISSGPRCW